MELSAALPAEVVALADSAARRAAPSPAPTGAGPPGQVPFDLLFGVLSGVWSGGEVRPAGGKALPLADVGAAAGSALGTVEVLAAVAVPPPVVSAGLPSEAVEATAEARACGAGVPPATARPVAALMPTTTPIGQATAGGGEPPAASFAAHAALDAAPADADAAPIELVLRRPADRPTPNEAQRLEALLANDARFRAQLDDAVARDARGGAQPAPPPGQVPPASWQAAAREAPAALTQAPPPVQLRALGIGRPAAAPPLAPTENAPSTAPPDWLPAASAHGATATAGAAAAPPPAATGVPVDTRAADWHDAFAERVHWVVDTLAGEAEIRLNPPELGTVHVKISLVDDKTHVHLVAATAAARDELAHALPRLRELFAAGGLELGSATVLDARGEHFGRGGEARHEGGAVHGRLLALDEQLDEPAAAATGPARGRIDVFA